MDVTLKNVTPSCAVHKVRDCDPMNTEHCGQLWLIKSAMSVVSKNLPCLQFGELVVPLFLSSATSALLHHVMRVVFACAKKQVIWAHASLVVAFMAYKRSVRDWSVFDYPRNAMHVVANHPRLVIKKVQRTIAFWRDATVPLPAFTGFRSPSPETNAHRKSFVISHIGLHKRSKLDRNVEVFASPRRSALLYAK